MSVSIYPIAFIDAFKSIIWQEEVEVSYRIKLCIKHFELFLTKSSNNKCKYLDFRFRMTFWLSVWKPKITCSNEMYKFMEDKHKERVPGHQQEAGAHVWECEQRVSHHTRRACWRRCSPAIALIAYLWRRRQTNMSTGRGPPRCAQITGYQHLGCIPQPGAWLVRDEVAEDDEDAEGSLNCEEFHLLFGKSQVRFSFTKFINSASNK